jgi:hypothetical protein
MTRWNAPVIPLAEPQARLCGTPGSESHLLRELPVNVGMVLCLDGVIHFGADATRMTDRNEGFLMRLPFR